MSESKHKKYSADNIEVAIKLNGSLMPVFFYTWTTRSKHVASSVMRVYNRVKYLFVPGPSHSCIS